MRFEQCLETCHSQINDPASAIVASTRQGKPTLVIAAMKMAATGRAMTPAFLKNASCVYGSLIDEDALAATNLGRGQKLPARVRVDAQEVSYLVRSANGWYGDTNGCSECKRESDENESRP
jgi:hypothetical protein